ncbi:MAG TPA: hypothetical protein PKE32_09325 [Miltoncostaeaceae bacterium]|nr:hypothetical protein [Miltoncostaeaceae bacterium]
MARRSRRLLAGLAVSATAMMCLAGSAQTAQTPQVKDLTASSFMGVHETPYESLCSQCGPGGTPEMLQRCTYILYLQYPNVPGATGYDAEVSDKLMRYTVSLHAPPFEDNKEGSVAPGGAHRWVGFTGGSGPAPCPTIGDFYGSPDSRFVIKKVTATCPTGCGASGARPPAEPKPGRIPPGSGRILPNGLPPLPVPPASRQRMRIASSQDIYGAQTTRMSVTRNGKKYSVDYDSVLQEGDIITTGSRTVASFEFLIGGRVIMNRGVSLEVVNERSVVTTGSTSVKAPVKNAPSLWLQSTSGSRNRPVELNTSSGWVGIKG